MIKISFPVFLSHTQGIKDMDPCAGDINSFLQRCHKVGIKFIPHTVQAEPISFFRKHTDDAAEFFGVFLTMFQGVNFPLFMMCVKNGTTIREEKKAGMGLLWSRSLLPKITWSI